jgi:hypothetical protein
MRQLLCMLVLASLHPTGGHRHLRAGRFRRRVTADARALFPDDVDGSAKKREGDDEQPAAVPLEEANLEYAVSAMCALENNLLRSCAACFSDEIQPIDAATTDTILLKALALENAASEERGGTILRAAEVSEALHGDWRLVFTNSKRTCDDGISGYASAPFVSTKAILQRMSKYSAPPRAQCFEVLQLPLGVKSAISLKGDWTLEDDDEGCILLTTYKSVDAGGQELPAMPKEATSLAAIAHVGVDARLERSPSGDLFIYKRQRGAAERIDAQLEVMLR